MLTHFQHPWDSEPLHPLGGATQKGLSLFTAGRPTWRAGSAAADACTCQTPGPSKMMTQQTPVSGRRPPGLGSGAQMEVAQAFPRAPAWGGGGDSCRT